jgi:hypothetical protein
VVRVHHTSDSKLGSHFAEALEHAGLSRAAPILSAEADDETGFLKVTVALSNVADWKLRSQVHQVGVTRRCGRRRTRRVRSRVVSSPGRIALVCPN